MNEGVCESLFGLGNAATDPATGEPLLLQKIKATGVSVPPTADFYDCNVVARSILALPKDVKVFIVAISCGANRIPWIIQAVAPRVIAGAYMIAPSVYCNAGCPPVADNAPNVWVFNGPWYLALPPGLSSYKPERVAGSKMPAIVRRWSNTWHPCDSDVVNVQNPILADIKRIMASA